MNRIEIKEFIKENFIDKLGSNSCSQTIRFRFKDILQDIINETLYLDNNNFNERLYHIFNNLYEIQKCECGNILEFLSFHQGYRNYCKKCNKPFAKLFENKDNNLCDFGCGRIAQYIYKPSGKICCEETFIKCPNITKKFGNDGDKNGMFGKKSFSRDTLESLKVKHPILFEHENIREFEDHFEVTCKNCGKWFKISVNSLKTRAMVLEVGNKRNYLFCNKECAESSGLYRLVNEPKVSKKFKEYHWKVYIRTEYYVRKFRDKIPNIELRSIEFPLDHKYSVREAFDNNVPIDIVAHYKNLEIITRSLNSTKRNKCSITLEELKREIKKEESNVQY